MPHACSYSAGSRGGGAVSRTVRALAAAAALCLEAARAQSACTAGCPFGWTNQSGACERCPAGHSIDLATGERCVGCPAGRFSNANMTICDNCPAGTSSGNTSSTCSACPAGTYSYPGDPQCQHCAPGKYTAAPGRPACDDCDQSRQDANSNRTGCVCKPGHFDAKLYPRMNRTEGWRGDVVWRGQPTCSGGGGPCCVECSKVICPADVCRIVDEDDEGDEKCAADPSRCELKCARKQTCVQCPGGGGVSPAYMWPKKMFWVPDPASLTVDPLNGDPETKSTALYGLLSVVAVEQCHPHELCAGLPEAIPEDSQGLVDYELCSTDPHNGCCANAGVQHGDVCGSCMDGYIAHPVSSRCERCDGTDWGRVLLFFLSTTMMATFFDFKARKLNVEEEGGGLAILIFFVMQLSLYAKTAIVASKSELLKFVQALIGTFLTLEPPEDEGGGSQCTFNLTPHSYFYFRVFFVPIYQYLLVLAIGHIVDTWVDPSDMNQVDPAGIENEQKESAKEKALHYLRRHYDSSNLRYLRILPEAPARDELSRSDAMRLWWQASTTSVKRKQAGKQMVRGQLQVLVAVYIPITKLCITMLFCQPVPNGNEVEWLSSFDASVGCSETRHVVAAIMALLVLVCFTCGFPLFIYLKMAWAASHVQERRVAWKPGRFTSLVRLSYVFKEDRRAWQAIVMMRQVWLVGAKVVSDLFASPENQTLPLAIFNGELDWRWGAFVPILISVHLQASYRPYALWHDNVLEQSCLLALLLVIWADVTLASNESMNMIVLACAILFIALTYVAQVRGRALAKSAHQADIFSFGEGGGDGPAPAVVDASSDEFGVTQTASMARNVKRKITTTADPVRPADEEETANPLAEGGLTRTASALNALKSSKSAIDPEAIKVLKTQLRLTNEEIEAEIKLFSTFDDDASGYLSVEELVKVFEIGRGVQVSDSTIATLMKDIDDNNDGRISFAEFVQVMVRHNRQRDANEELVEAFKIFLESCEEADDEEPASRITGEMICEVFKRAGIFGPDATPASEQRRVQALLDAATKDDDGNWRPGMGESTARTIPFPAFRNMMTEFGNPMSSSFGISLRQQAAPELPELPEITKEEEEKNEGEGDAGDAGLDEC